MSRFRQQSLPGTKAPVSHSKRGKIFEGELETLHDWYRFQRIVDVVKNPEKWTCVGKLEEKQTADQYLQGKGDNFAVTGLGWIYKRENSEVDYSGGNDLCSFIFDAKETTRKDFPMEKLKTHQISRLYQSSQCRTVAGFMILFVKLDRCFFAPVSFVRKKEEIWLRQQGKRATPGTASITVAELEQNGKEIFRHRHNALFDWYSVLLPEKSR